MSSEHYLFCIVIASFSIIHFVEVSSFLARYSGVCSGDNALAYATQSAVYMVTRFFSMLLLPILGLVVDLGVSRNFYLFGVGVAVLGATCGGLLALLLRGKLVACFCEIVLTVKRGGSLLRSLVYVPFKLTSVHGVFVPICSLREATGSRIFWFSSFVFALYATSVFIAFYFGLIFHDYRSSISQLSAVTNAFATVLLTFYIEPKISIAIDKKDDPEKKIVIMLLGRIFGVGVFSYVPLIILWSLS